MEWLKEAALWLWNNQEFRFVIDAAWKLALSVLLSGIIGFEREHSHRPAGFRTHILVAVGSTLIMLTSVYISKTYEGQANVDITRMAAQVVSGIGFLGAGTILREGFSVKGLTTAASLWAVSCIGIAVGAGFVTGACVATFVIYMTLNSLKKVIVRGKAGKAPSRCRRSRDLSSARARWCTPWRSFTTTTRNSARKRIPPPSRRLFSRKRTTR